MKIIINLPNIIDRPDQELTAEHVMLVANDGDCHWVLAHGGTTSDRMAEDLADLFLTATKDYPHARRDALTRIVTHCLQEESK